MQAVDEYTDYSCSTSIERLARDVETALRNWHVHESDRHVSVRDKESQQLSPMQRGVSAATASVIASPTGKRHLPHEDVIRTTAISWNISYYRVDGMKISANVDLDLTLWDGPALRRTNLTSSATCFDATKSKHATKEGDLPYSLQRLSFLNELPHALFDDLSALFGIGQHITLTPKQPDHIDGDLLNHLAESLWQRHTQPRTAVPALLQVLSSWLQTALNMAVTSCQCILPVFGIWGCYRKKPPLLQQNNFTTHRGVLTPLWLRAIPEMEQTWQRYQNRQRKFRNRRSTVHVNTQYAAPIVAGHLLADESVAASFSLQILPASLSTWNTTDRPLRWSTWARLLQRHTQTKEVALWVARHIYVWDKPPVYSRHRLLLEPNVSYDDLYNAWRRDRVQNANVNLTTESVDEYRAECRALVLDILDQAWGAKAKREPLWGPHDDPVAAVHVTVSWNDRSLGTDGEQPLLALPLKTRSKRNMTESDLIDAEQTMEESLLDPKKPSSFAVQVYYDHETPQTPLAATQRCVLAALIRTATLPEETMLSHLVDETLMDRWDGSAGNVVAMNLGNKAHVSQLTQALVAAMDWTHASEDMIETWQADEIIDSIMDGCLTLRFPSPPDVVFTDSAPPIDHAFKPILKSAYPGRLLSILFSHMARVRSPSSMARVWKMFVLELRRRWDARESLPNMTYIPGLDPPQNEANSKRCFSSIGVWASLSAQVNSSEPDPDDINCLIGQKLQVFNLCLESAVASEIREVEQIEKRQRLESSDDTTINSFGLAPRTILKSTGTRAETFSQPGDAKPTNTLSSASRHSDAKQAATIATTRTLFHGSMVDGMPEIESPDRSLDDDTSTVLTCQFFDAEEVDEVLFSSNMSRVDMEKSSLGSIDHTQVRERKGARCPMKNINLLETGDQLYAPYLQRPYPLTDDVITQRRMMLLKQKSSGKASSTVLRRMEVAHLLQKPKLLSDMQAFKAANPNAIFQDFVNWYGNPRDPLEEYEESLSLALRPGTSDTIETKLDKAKEGIYVLSMTRDFWTGTWKEAKPLSASFQEPLFDATMTVEMMLDFLETLHPATLLCQIMAVNLTAAYFTLSISAGEATNIESVMAALEYLRGKVEQACQLISVDTTAGSGPREKGEDESKDVSCRIVSVESLSACENACVAIGEAEFIISKAKSLLHKFPGQYQFVECILKNPEGCVTDLCGENGRRDILKAIVEQQQRVTGTTLSVPPVPFAREYVLRNYDETKPCQLAVRQSNIGLDGACNGLVLALGKCIRE
jgi:hypothetical protein